MHSNSKTPVHVPTLDFAKLRSSDDNIRSQAEVDLGTALQETGFFILENHTVEAQLIGKAYQEAEAFFTLSDAQKAAYEKPELNGQRGYTSFGKEQAVGADQPDLKEFWQVGRTPGPDESDHPYGGNFWPVERPEMGETFTALYDQLQDCGMALLQAASRYLQQPEDALTKICTGGESILRVIHYPPVPEDAHPASMRAAAHEDINLITLLCEATSPGLELLTREGEWFPIQAKPGQIIVDAGDMLQNISNGVFKSTTHRVTNPNADRSRRFSMPFFLHPRLEASLNPYDSCLEVRHGIRYYPDITAGEYLHQRLSEIGMSSQKTQPKQEEGVHPHG